MLCFWCSAFLIFRVRLQPLCSGCFVCFGSKRSLANCVDSCGRHCESCTGKVPKLSTQSETTRSLQQRRLCNNYNFGTATSDHGLKRSSVKIVQCKKVKLQSCRYRPLFWMQSSFVLCFEALLFWLLILTFPSQWHIFGVPRHSLCSGSFVCFGSHRSLANRTTVEVVVASQHSMNFSGTV